MRPLVLVWLAALSTSLACTEPNPRTCLDNHCNDPKLPFCDVDGAIAGEANTCIAVSCTAGEFAACRGDNALMCNATGDSYDLLACEYGCGETGCNTCNTTECEKRIVPKYLPTICEQLSPDASLTIATDTMLDTSDDLACTSVVPQTAGPEICVLHYGTITIERNRTYRATGSRVLALVADRELLIDGTLDVSADQQSTNGPGGGVIRSGTAEGVPGGGAGYRHAGGSGASPTADGGAANGGSAAAHPSQLAELLGGSRPTGIASGAGGGGVTLISCRANVSVVGVIDAGGGGGQRGSQSGFPMTYYPPTGGGAGGTVVLQGIAVSVTGELYANGGGGGGGGPALFGSSNGGDGRRSMSPAVGGTASTGDCGAGGAGGTVDLPRHGKMPLGADTCGGAGGGSAGFHLVYVPPSVVPTLTPVAASPPIEAPGLVATN